MTLGAHLPNVMSLIRVIMEHGHRRKNGKRTELKVTAECQNWEAIY